MVQINVLYTGLSARPRRRNSAARRHDIAIEFGGHLSTGEMLRLSCTRHQRTTCTWYIQAVLLAHSAHAGARIRAAEVQNGGESNVFCTFAFPVGSFVNAARLKKTYSVMY
jgi:hypothetical protein